MTESKKTFRVEAYLYPDREPGSLLVEWEVVLLWERAWRGGTDEGIVDTVGGSAESWSEAMTDVNKAIDRFVQKGIEAV